jgi:hypothetical protein
MDDDVASLLATGPEAPDLWPRLRARIAASDAASHVRLRVPAVGWQAVAALVTVATAPLVAPEPGRLLAVFAVFLGVV